MPHHGATQPQIDALSIWLRQRPNVASVEAAERLETGGLLLRADDDRGFPVANLEVSSIVLQDYPEPADLLDLLDTGGYRQKLQWAGVQRCAIAPPAFRIVAQLKCNLGSPIRCMRQRARTAWASGRDPGARFHFRAWPMPA